MYIAFMLDCAHRAHAIIVKVLRSESNDDKNAQSTFLSLGRSSANWQIGDWIDASGRDRAGHCPLCESLRDATVPFTCLNPVRIYLSGQIALKPFLTVYHRLRVLRDYKPIFARKLSAHWAVFQDFAWCFRCEGTTRMSLWDTKFISFNVHLYQCKLTLVQFFIPF